MAHLSIVSIAHACTLLSFGKQSVLTDPCFSGKPRRPAMESAGLPELSAAFVSHDHPEHSDVSALPRSLPLVLGPGRSRKYAKMGFSEIRELAPWEEAEFGKIRIMAAPAKHSADEITAVLRGLGFTVFFGADTSFVPELAELPGRVGRVDLAILPVSGKSVGIFSPKKDVMGPEDAAGLCTVLRPRVAVPILHEKDPTLSGRFTAAARLLAPETMVRVLAPGAEFRLDHEPGK